MVGLQEREDMWGMKKLLSICTILTFGLLCISCQSDNNQRDSSQSVKPFKVVLEKANIIEEPTQLLEGNNIVPGIGTTKRLEIAISITNEQDVAYDNTKFKVALNEEAKKFIASGVIERESDPFYIVPKGAETGGMNQLHLLSVFYLHV